MTTFATIITASYNFPLYIKVFISFLGGLIPVLIWLWFWEHEDKHPQPKKLILYAFLGGMLAVVAALVLEEKTATVSPDFITVLIVWVIIEELLKFGAAYLIVLSRAENKEPIDSMMYMIATALGFAALENALFIFRPVLMNSNLEALATGNMRFIGATLLHTMTSGIIGLSLSLSFYRSKRARFVYVTLGVITAIVLHAFFNLSIIVFNDSWPLIPFYGVWIVTILLLLAFEKVKSLTPPK
jgi:RsiW-degrading membrane proteinase PrsW (M82 family)